MKKIFTIIIAALLFAVSFDASAVGAYPYPIKVTQPDGSVITIRIHGDEFHHWITSENQVVIRDADGFYRPAPEDPSFVRAAPVQERMANAPQKVSGNITTGEKHFLVVLVQFSDLSFSIPDPQLAFTALLNEKEYSANGATGSVRDYYSQNSNNEFKPIFDVVGPVTVSQGYAYYGSGSNGNDAHAALAFWEACKRIDGEVDFSQYDLDSNGVIDNIFFYFAGHNEAEGATSDHIWPHKWDIRSAANSDKSIKGLTFDNKTIGTYACTSELKGYDGTTMCGIGTFCHEFGHVLGLPDFYDVDYESNGSAYGMGPFSLMASGNYNNAGRTPPALTGIERQIIGWMSGLTEWKEPGSKTVPDIMSNQAFMSKTSNNGEYFVYEARGGNVWDSYIGDTGVQGLLIYHIDRSANSISGQTAAQLWSSGKINAYGEHPCCQIEPASGIFTGTSQSMVYPGSGNVSAFDENSPSPMVEWSGMQPGTAVTDIVYADDAVTLTFGKLSGKTVSGTVKDRNGNPVIGATVVLSPAASSMSSQKLQSGPDLTMRRIDINKAPKGGDYSATISSDGKFYFDLADNDVTDYTLSVSCYGYLPYGESIRLKVGNIERDIVLSTVSVISEETEYQRFDWDVTTRVSYGQAVVCAIKYNASELRDAVGSRIQGIGYAINECSATDVRLIVDFGDETVYEKKLTDPEYDTYAYVDISDADIIIPEGKDVYVGIYVDAPSDQHPFYINKTVTGNDGYYVRLLSSHRWQDECAKGSLALWFTLAPVFTQAYAYGFNGIANPKDGQYSAGEEFALDLVESVSVPDSVDWFFDDEAVTGPSVTLTAGEHVVKAILHFNSGRTETIVQEITAE